MIRHDVKSSNIKSIGYDPESQLLEVEFNGGGIFQYKEVPKEVHEKLMEAESKGAYFQKSIRTQYKFEKV